MTERALPWVAGIVVVLVLAVAAVGQQLGKSSAPAGATKLLAKTVSGYHFEMWAWTTPSNEVCHEVTANRPLHILGTGNGGGCDAYARATTDVELTTVSLKDQTVIFGLVGRDITTLRIASANRPVLTLPAMRIGSADTGLVFDVVSGKPTRSDVSAFSGPPGKLEVRRTGSCEPTACLLNA